MTSINLKGLLESRRPVGGYRYPDLMTVRNARGKSITAHAYRFKLVA